MSRKQTKTLVASENKYNEMKRTKSFLKYSFPFILVFTVFFYNEYLIYWHVISSCNWPKGGYDDENVSNKLVNVMLIADTHLLGKRNGHWFDKLRREWQQHRAFQTSRQLLRPDYIVILGDVTDGNQRNYDFI